MHSTYDQYNIDQQTYDTARELPAETGRLWMEAIASYIPAKHVEQILDLGSGTGRFSRLLSETFDADVTALEPSEKMRRHAIAHNPLPERVTVLAGAGEAIPLADASVDLVFVSMVYHHLPDSAATLQEIRRVLRSPGYLVIRNTTRDNFFNIPMFDFFPAARVAGERQFPDRRELRQQVCSARFSELVLTPVKQLFAATYHDYLAKLSQRGVSTLNLISDEDFALGLDRLSEYCAKHGDEPVYEEHDLFVAECGLAVSV